MAQVNTIPPQAYTRDTLVKAIEWIGTQPPSVRERANSADLVVSFYLQARKTAAGLEAPISHEHFKSDLRHLAEDLKKFEDPSPSHSLSSPPTGSNRSPSYGYSAPTLEMWPPKTEPLQAPRAELRNDARFFESSSRFETAPHPHFEKPPRFESVRAEPPPAPQMPRAEPPRAPQWPVDARSLQAAREIQERLNIGSETEALRMLVTLGLERAREIFR
jgi:hypothetical protein